MADKIFPTDFTAEASPTLSQYVMVSNGTSARKVLNSDFATMLAGASSPLATAIASGELANPVEQTTNAVMDTTSTMIVLSGAIYSALPAQTVPTVRLIYVTVGAYLVPEGYPASTQSINGLLNTIVMAKAGLFLLIGDGASGWAFLAADASPRDDFSKANGPPIATDDVDSGYSVGSHRIDSSGDVWMCTDASSGAAVWVKLN